MLFNKANNQYNEEKFINKNSAICICIMYPGLVSKINNVTI